MKCTLWTGSSLRRMTTPASTCRGPQGAGELPEGVVAEVREERELPNELHPPQRRVEPRARLEAGPAPREVEHQGRVHFGADQAVLAHGGCTRAPPGAERCGG